MLFFCSVNSLIEYQAIHARQHEMLLDAKFQALNIVHVAKHKTSSIVVTSAVYFIHCLLHVNSLSLPFQILMLIFSNEVQSLLHTLPQIIFLFQPQLSSAINQVTRLGLLLENIHGINFGLGV